MRKFLFVFSLYTIILSTTLSAHAETLYEGWHKIISSNVHVGYLVQRYQFDSKKNEFTSTYYLKTNAAGGDITESLHATATKSLKPLSYQYTSKAGKSLKLIDANVKGDQLLAKVKEGDKEQTLQVKLEKDTFFSTFLVYLMLNSKEGLKENTKYNYSAVAEEDGAVFNGEAFIKNTETIGGVSTYKILNNFKRVQFISNVTAKGEVIGTRSPMAGLVTEASTKAAATRGFTVETASLKTLFGDVPQDAQTLPNQMAPTDSAPQPAVGGQADAEKTKKLNAVPEETPFKGSEVPPGKGIQLKDGKAAP